MYKHTSNQETITTHLNSTLKPAGAATTIMETHPNDRDGEVVLHQPKNRFGTQAPWSSFFEFF
jgi:hypothetical protein